MNRQQVIQLIIFALFIGASGIGWILRRIGEQAQRRAAEQALERRRLELFRTGRDPGTKPDVSPITPETARSSSGGDMTVAERRQRQLEELRRRQVSRTKAHMPGQTEGPTTRQGPVRSGSRFPSRADGGSQVRVPDMYRGEPGRGFPTAQTGSPKSPSPTGGGGSRGQSASRTPNAGSMSGRPTPSRPPLPGRSGGGPDLEDARKEALRRHQERVRRNAQEQARRAPEGPRTTGNTLESDIQGESSTRQLLDGPTSGDSAYAIDRTIPAAATLTADGRRRLTSAPILVAGVPLTAADWRRAMVVNEVLGKPVCLRDDPTPYIPD